MLFLLAAELVFVQPAVGHEAYTVPQEQFHEGLASTTANPLAPLALHHYIWLTLGVFGFVGVTYLVEMLFIATETGYTVDTFIKHGEKYGPVLVRVAVGLSFLFAAYTDTIFGPELSLFQLPFPHVLKFVLFAVGVMLLTGFLVETAAVAGLVLFTITAFQFGEYLLTYANYLGELLVLVLFGSRHLSLDGLLFGERDRSVFDWLDRFSDLEIPIIRVFYGVALIYAGVTIKFLHQDIAVQVFHQYHLGQFFPASAQWTAAFFGVGEVLVGLLILLGLTVRWTTLLSLFFITISLFYFQELLWPHLILYGISFNLIINTQDRLSLDGKLIPWLHEKLEGHYHRYIKGEPA